MIKHEYGIAEESGTWYVTRDGEPIRNYAYRSKMPAQSAAKKLTTANNLWHAVFEIEHSIATALQGTPWPYGATCVNHGTDDNPEWILTEPYLSEATRTVNPDPTGHVQINIYTRDLYERACTIIGVSPISDSHISGQHEIPRDIDPTKAVEIRLANRRAAGLMVECMNEQNSRVDRLEAAGLMIDEFTREQYEHACEIMDSAVLSDFNVMLVVTLNLVRGIGLDVTFSEVPNDAVTTSLAYRRSLGITRERHDQKDGDTKAGTAP